MLTYTFCYIYINMFSLNRICLQISSVMTLSYHLVDKLYCGLCKIEPQLREAIYSFFLSGRYNILRSAEMQILELRLALLSAGYIRLVWPKTERLCLFGSVSDTTAQPKCWWCSVFSRSIYSTHFSCLFIWGLWCFWVGSEFRDLFTDTWTVCCRIYGVIQLWFFTLDNKSSDSAWEKNTSIPYRVSLLSKMEKIIICDARSVK